MTKISDVRLSEALGFEINTASPEPFRDLLYSQPIIELRGFMRAHRFDIFGLVSIILAILALVCF